ncbi:hypothetical protein ACFU44_31345 [Nocardia rhizosphaerihabitans]|uniref:hypothetical protein n=1 Tax=Nocardia rhizosphaerihabitans TaxID=1691570 RepID=UPI0036710899
MSHQHRGDSSAPAGYSRSSLTTFAARPHFDDTLDIIVATVRGTMIIAAIPGADTLHSPWPKLKEHLLAQVLGRPTLSDAVSPGRTAATN